MPELAPGGQLGAYRILSVIGRGGMGVVYLVEDAGLGRRVALKVLAPQFSADSNFRTRFERESRLAASLDHPNVVPIYEAGEIDDVLFIAMRYVDGPDLRTVLDKEAHFDATRALGISAQLASALDAAHAHGLIHRDVKPGNVLLAAGYGSDGGEHVYLSDFGLTKRSSSKSGLTQLGQLVGTIDYIAPEQITGGAVDGRADIYALGCVFFEMLAGKAPFARETDLATMAAHMHEPPPSLTALRPDLPPAADAVVARVLAKDPDQRYSSGAEFVRAARGAMGAASHPTAVDAVGRAGATIIAPSLAPPAAPSPHSASGGGSSPPYSPTSAPAFPQPRLPRSRVPFAIVAVAVVVGLALVSGVALAIVGLPKATPTYVAQVSPSAPVFPLPAATAVPTPIATIGPATPSPTQSTLPTGTPATASPTATTPSPTVSPSPTLPPTPPPSAEYGQLLAQLDSTVGNCTEDVTNYNATPVTEVLCTRSDFSRRYALFATKSDLDKAWNWFNITASDRCTGFGSQKWSYTDIDPSTTRGRVACFTKGRLGADSPQMMFTYDDKLLLGVILGTAGSSPQDLTNSWTADDGIIPPSQ